MRAMILAAAAVVCVAFAMPAQARIADGGLNAKAPGVVEDAHYTGYAHSHRRHYNNRRYRHCWNDRVRVRTPGGHIVVRVVRRCAYRYR